MKQIEFGVKSTLERLVIKQTSLLSADMWWSKICTSVFFYVQHYALICRVFSPPLKTIFSEGESGNE